MSAIKCGKGYSPPSGGRIAFCLQSETRFGFQTDYACSSPTESLATSSRMTSTTPPSTMLLA